MFAFAMPRVKVYFPARIPLLWILTERRVLSKGSSKILSQAPSPQDSRVPFN
jgi:hypothetical protein